MHNFQQCSSLESIAESRGFAVALLHVPYHLQCQSYTYQVPQIFYACTFS